MSEQKFYTDSEGRKRPITKKHGHIRPIRQDSEAHLNVPKKTIKKLKKGKRKKKGKGKAGKETEKQTEESVKGEKEKSKLESKAEKKQLPET